MADVVIVGGGFAGYWSAVRAAQAVKKFRAEGIRITLISADRYFTLRPRLYEGNLAGARLELEPLLQPLGVRLVEGTVTALEPEGRHVVVTTPAGEVTMDYDQLVLAVGSRLHRPEIPGLREHGFSVDSYAEAQALAAHLAALGTRPVRPGTYTTVVAGSGLTGLETATSLVERLRQMAGGATVRVVLVERAEQVAPNLGDYVRRVVEQALKDLGIEVRTATSVMGVAPEGVKLSTGEFIPAATTIWTAGVRAQSLAGSLPVERDPLGRLPVDEHLRVVGLPGIFAAGDVARAMADDAHLAPMTCQHAIPQGKVAGHNAVATLVGRPLVTYRQPTIARFMDLGQAGGLVTAGWDQKVRMKGRFAKMAKWLITRRVIVPPGGARYAN